MKRIAYDIVEAAVAAYEFRGYKYLEVPWVVSDQAMNATVPVGCPMFEGERGAFVASGEQSFIQLILEGKLSKGRYCCATPCYRPWDNGKSPLHQTQFFKVELIDYVGDDGYSLSPMKSQYDMIRDAAYSFMSFFFNDLQFIETQDDPRQECTTVKSSDIVTKEGIELGSYGIRSHPKTGTWIYGTGVALPRFTSV
jgi:hypothetical protein